MLSAQLWFNHFFTKKAQKLNASNPDDLKLTAQIIKNGGIVAFPFNGIFGLFGDADNPRAAKKIMKAKNRPQDKNLIIVSDPDYIEEHVDFEKLNFNKKMLTALWRKIHALGIILPASNKAPRHLVSKNNETGNETILSIWTEYEPLKEVIAHFRKLKGRALVGTSANKSGQATHNKVETLWDDFSSDVDAIVEASFDHLPEHRKKSTTVVDFTLLDPKLFRLGNVEEKELRKLLSNFGFPKLQVSDNLKIVTVRK